MRTVIAILLLLSVSVPAGADFDALLARYVQGDRVDYAAWTASGEDRAALQGIIDDLASRLPTLELEAERLAAWINLYNAVTLRLVLDHYPVESIKDTGGLLDSPWNRRLVTVDDEELSLNAIENEIIRPRYGDPRVHFALNCASIGCPPLASEAYSADRLDAQLDAACRRALADARWLDDRECDGVGGRLRLTKIFDWYRDDFLQNGGTLRGFLAHYRSDLRRALFNPECKLEYSEYDWSLNDTTTLP